MQITIRSDDKSLEQEIRELAHREGLSLNRAALKLLRRGAGLDGEPATGVGQRLAHLAGTWDDREADEMLESLSSFGGIDDELWK